MAVVISDFEVVVDAPQETQGDDGEQTSRTQAAASTPQDIEQVLRRHLERLERVRAR